MEGKLDIQNVIKTLSVLDYITNLANTKCIHFWKMNNLDSIDSLNVLK